MLLPPSGGRHASLVVAAVAVAQYFPAAGGGPARGPARASGRLRYMISYMISRNYDIANDIICLELYMIS